MNLLIIHTSCSTRHQRKSLRPPVPAVLLVGLSLFVPTTVLAQSTVYYVHTDALGTPSVITDAAGVAVEFALHDPFGQPLLAEAADTPGFAGHVADKETSLSYMQQRYYDPVLGRFLSVDPVTAGQRDGSNFNRYWYANNNPYTFIDPDGRLGETWRCSGATCGLQNLLIRLTRGAEAMQAKADTFSANAAQVGSSLREGKGTLQVGVVVSGSAVVGGKVGAGVAVDGRGSLATYTEYGVAGGPKADVAAAMTVHLTNAGSVADLQGPSLDGALGAGAAVGGSADVSAAQARDGSPVVGFGVTIGAAAGGGGTAGVTQTNIQPVKVNAKEDRH